MRRVITRIRCLPLYITLALPTLGGVRVIIARTESVTERKTTTDPHLTLYKTHSSVSFASVLVRGSRLRSGASWPARVVSVVQTSVRCLLRIEKRTCVWALQGPDYTSSCPGIYIGVSIYICIICIHMRKENHMAKWTKEQGVSNGDVNIMKKQVQATCAFQTLDSEHTVLQIIWKRTKQWRKHANIDNAELHVFHVPFYTFYICCLCTFQNSMFRNMCPKEKDR